MGLISIGAILQLVSEQNAPALTTKRFCPSGRTFPACRVQGVHSGGPFCLTYEKLERTEERGMDRSHR